jgi:hypothetical protein
MDEKLKELLKQANYFAFQFECMAPFYLVMCQPYRSEEARKNAQSIWEDVERAKQFRIEIEEYLKENKIEIS